jgi:Skp family chaperone for outer membrane proteins
MMPERLALLIFTPALMGLLLCAEITNVISIQTATSGLVLTAFISSLINYFLYKQEKQEKAEQEILREREEKQRMRKEIETLKAELEKNKKQN